MAYLHYTPPALVQCESPNAGQPPAYCDTQAENSVGVHFVGLTHRHDRSGRSFGHFLNVPDDEWEEQRHGGYLFRRCRVWRGVRVYYDPLVDGAGSYCQISGAACEELVAAGKVRDWQEFAIQALEVFCFKCVRLDLFKDDQQGLLDMDELERKLESSEVTTHAQEYERRSKRVKGMGEKRVSDTINIGSRKSDSYMRIYNKTLQLRPKGRKIDEWCAEHGHHVRVELELKRKRAQAAMKRLALTGFGMGFIPGLIRGFIDFKEADASGHNGRRVPVWGPWLEFLSGEEKVRLEVATTQPSLSKAVYYLRKQYGPTLAAEAMRFGGDKDELLKGLMDVISEGRARMGPKHYRMVAEAKRAMVA